MEIKISLRQLLQSGHLEFLTKEEREFFNPKNNHEWTVNLPRMIAHYKDTFLYLPLVLIREDRFKVTIFSDGVQIESGQTLVFNSVKIDIRSSKLCQALCTLWGHIESIDNALTYIEPVAEEIDV